MKKDNSEMMPPFKPQVLVRMGRSVYEGDDWSTDMYQRVPLMYYNWPYYNHHQVSLQTTFEDISNIFL